jgi:hypothetical protein
MSMFKRLGNLPFDGRTLTTSEESCDPYEELCKTPLHVWEVKCTRCCGTGHARLSASRGRGGSRARGSLSICLVCSGLGEPLNTPPLITVKAWCGGVAGG